MNETRYKWILYVIVAVIIGTIGIQVYWNYKNYEINKQQLINDVQLSLDQAVEKYYAQLAEEQTIGFAFESRQHDSVYSRYTMFDSLIGVLDFSSKKINCPYCNSRNHRNGTTTYFRLLCDSRYSFA